MKFEVTAPTDRALREVDDLQLFELYHTNSKLTVESALRAVSTTEPGGIGQYLTTRGFRQYSRGPAVPLPAAEPPDGTLAEVLGRRRSEREFGGPVELAELGTILEQSLGCTAVVEDPDTGLAHALRAWPSAGGLYPLDTYVAARDVKGLQPALYHYNPIRSDLERVPSRDVEAVLRDGYFDQEFTNASAAALLLVASFTRTVAKYGERGYRLVLLDAGHAAQNVLLSAAQLGVSAVAIAGYCDDSLASDLGIDGVSEAVVHTILLGRSPHA